MSRKDKERIKQILNGTEMPISATQHHDSYSIKFTPSELGVVKVLTSDGKTKLIRANRRERRHGEFG